MTTKNEAVSKDTEKKVVPTIEKAEVKKTVVPVDPMKELEKKIISMRDRNMQAIADCQGNIDDADKAIEKANADIKAAEDATDPKKYSSAKDALRVAKDTKELYLKRKNKLANEPVITTDEYNALLNEITSVANVASANYYDQAKKLIDPIDALAEKVHQNIVEANKLFGVVQFSIYRDADSKVRGYSTKKEYGKNARDWYFTNVVEKLKSHVAD